MSATAFRTIKHARDTLVDGLGLGLTTFHRCTGPDCAGCEPRHGLTRDQARSLENVADQLLDLLISLELDTEPGRGA